MTKYQIDILKQALLMAELKELERLESLPEQEVVFSKEFEENIRKISKKVKSFAWNATKTVSRRVAVGFIAAVITFCMMMSISAIRVPVVNFFVNIYEEFISIFVDKGEDTAIPENIENIILPSYIPDGYNLYSSENYEQTAESYWFNDEDGFILLYQYILSNTKLQLDNEDNDYEKENIGDITLYYFSKNDENTIAWSNGSYLFMIIHSDDISVDEVKKIILSVD